MWTTKFEFFKGVGLVARAFSRLKLRGATNEVRIGMGYVCRESASRVYARPELGAENAVRAGTNGEKNDSRILFLRVREIRRERVEMRPSNSRADAVVLPEALCGRVAGVA